MWKQLAKSVQGTSHIKNNLPCQDYSKTCILEFAGHHYFFAVCSDGAGTASHAAAGAQKACATCLNHMKKAIKKNQDISSYSHVDVDVWINECRNSLKLLASVRKKELAEFSCTLIGAIAGDSGTLFFQLGDGGIVYSENGHDYRKVFNSQKGEYDNQTVFLTSDSYKSFQFYVMPESIKRLAMFTDGLENLVIDNKTNAPHVPFFNFIFNPLTLDHAIPYGDFTDFLKSPRVTEKTDDDITLVLGIKQ